MAVLSVYIPESDTDRVFNAVASNHGWSSDTGQSIQSFVNQVIRNFLQEHVKAFEITEARVAAEAAAKAADIAVNQVIGSLIQEHAEVIESLIQERTEVREAAAIAMNQVISAIAGSHVDFEDATTVTPYRYFMVCVDAVKAQYDGIAGQLLPGAVFDVNLVDGVGNVFWGLSLDATEGMRESLAAMELLGGTVSGGVTLLYYVRCDFVSGIAVSSNIDGFDRVGVVCSFGDVLSFLGLTEIGGV